MTEKKKTVSENEVSAALKGLGIGMGGMAVLSALFPIGAPLVAAATALAGVGLVTNGRNVEEANDSTNDEKQQLFFQRVAEDIRCIAGKTLADVATNLGLTKQAVIKWETKVTDPETGEVVGFNAKLSKPNYLALLHYYSLCCAQQTDNTALQTIIPFLCRYVPDIATEDNVADLIECIAKHKKVDLPIDPMLFQKLTDYLK